MSSQTSKGQSSKSPSVRKLYVRYMLSLRCKMVTRHELEKLGIHYLISLEGALVFPKGISREQQEKLKKNLHESGLELLDTSESIMIDKIIGTITELVHHTDSLPKISYKDIITENMGSESSPILKIFTEVKGVSVTQFIIQQKIERAKELLLYHDFSMAEIAEKLNYKSVGLFLTQFKKITDLPPSYFLELKEKRQKAALAATGKQAAC